MPPITFTDEDFKGIDPTQDDPMVISVDIDNFTIKKTLVDQGSSVDILYWKTFKAMRIPEEEMMPYNDHVVGFSGKRVGTKGYIELYTTFGLEGASKTLKIRYLVIDANTSYNILIGRSSLNKLGAIVSTPHLAMKFPSPSGDILTVHVDQKIARECYAESLRVEPTRQKPTGSYSPKRKMVGRGRGPRKHSPQPRNAVAMADLDPREIEPRLEVKDELRQAELGEGERYTSIGTAMAAVDAQKERRPFCLDNGRCTRCSPGHHHPPPLRIQGSTPSSPEEEELWGRQEVGSQNRGRKAPKGRLHRRSTILHLVGKYSDGEKGERQMTDVR